MLTLSIMFNSLKPNSFTDGLIGQVTVYPLHWGDSGSKYAQVYWHNGHLSKASNRWTDFVVQMFWNLHTCARKLGRNSTPGGLWDRLATNIKGVKPLSSALNLTGSICQGPACIRASSNASKRDVYEPVGSNTTSDAHIQTSSGNFIHSRADRYRQDVLNLLCSSPVEDQ